MSSFPSEQDPEKGYLDLTSRQRSKKIVEDVASVLKTTLTPKGGFGWSRWLFRKASSASSKKILSIEKEEEPEIDDGESVEDEDEQVIVVDDGGSDAEDEREEEETKDDITSEVRKRALDRNMSSIEDAASLTMADDAYKLFEDGSSVDLLAERRLMNERSSLPTRHAAINGAWELSKRGTSLDTLLASEGVSFGSRVLMSASAATVWFSVDAVRATIHVQESLIAHHFAGPLNTPVRVRKFAGRETSPYVIDTVTMSEDGNVLKLVQSSLVHGSPVMEIEWRVVKPKKNKGSGARLERRMTRGNAQTALLAGNKKSSRRRRPRIFKQTAHFDDYRRATPDRAIKIELAAAN